MRAIFTLIITMGLFGAAMLVAVPVMDKLSPVAKDMAPGYAGMIDSIWSVSVKWIVVVFFATMVLWAVFWILRQERQQVGR